MASSKGSGPGTMLFKPGDVPNPLFSAPIIALISIGVGYAIEHFQLESLLEVYYKIVLVNRLTDKLTF